MDASRYVIAGSRGGPNRLHILISLIRGPLNANEISTVLSLDYKTVRRHLDILLGHGFLSFSEGYGGQYSLTKFGFSVLDEYRHVVSEFGLTLINKKGK